MSFEAKQSFVDKLNERLRQAKADGKFDVKKNGAMHVGQRFFDIIKELFASIDLSSMTKDEFLAAVGNAYDSFIAPMITSAAGPMGVIINAGVRVVVLSMAAHFYDNHSHPAPQPS